MASLRLYNKQSITRLGAVILLLAVVMGGGELAVNSYNYIRSRPKPQSAMPLESDAVDAADYGHNFLNEDRDNNGMRESYFTDPVTNIQYRARLNPLTKELTLTQVK